MADARSARGVAPMADQRTAAAGVRRACDWWLRLPCRSVSGRRIRSLNILHENATCAGSAGAVKRLGDLRVEAAAGPSAGRRSPIRHRRRRRQGNRSHVDSEAIARCLKRVCDPPTQAMGLPEVFKESAERVKKLADASNDDKLELYSLFKQSNIGDCNTNRPGGVFNMSEKAKWDAWNARKGMGQDEAMKAYINKVDSLCGTSFGSQV